MLLPYQSKNLEGLFMHRLRAIPALTLFFVTLLNMSNLLGMIHLDDIMTPDEQQKTGISQLTNEQKQALESWINETFVLKTKSLDSTALSLQQNIQNGSQLELSDGSIYAIAPSDQPKTSLWLTPISIKIGPSGDLQYPTLLTNSLTGEGVKAKQIKAPLSPNKSHP